MGSSLWLFAGGVMSNDVVPQLVSSGVEQTTEGLPDVGFVKRWAHALRGLEDVANLQQFRKDCGVAHTLNTSFWVPARDGRQPRCALECMAVEVFERHAKGHSFQRASSGAEWWTQVTKADAPIELHWDKDEELFAKSGCHQHPTMSTVTYLGCLGAPTLVLQKTDAQHGSISRAALSWPAPSAHLRFNGRLLHGALPLPAVASPLSGDKDGLDAYRATFLVNIWLDCRPTACNFFQRDCYAC